MRELDVLARFEELKREGDLSAAERLLREWSDATGEFEDQWLTFAALQAFATIIGRIDKAFEYSLRLVELDPEDAHAHSCLGEAHRLRGELIDAERELRMALHIAEIMDDPGTELYAADLARVQNDLQG